MTPEQILSSMGNFDPSKPYERREWTFKDTYFIECGALISSYDFWAGNENKHKQYLEGKFPYTNKSMFATHLLVTHDLKLSPDATIADYSELMQAQLMKYFLEQSWIEFSTEFTDSAGRYFLRDLVEMSVIPSMPATATTYMGGRDNRLNYYPLLAPLVLGSGKDFGAKFVPATHLYTRAKSNTLTPYLPDNKVGGTDNLGTCNRGHSITLWMKGYQFNSAVSR